MSGTSALAIVATAVRRSLCKHEYFVRSFTASVSSSTDDWRKQQLEKLKQKFKTTTDRIIEKDEDLQSNWKQMERRVIHRKPLTKEQRGSSDNIGRRNIRKTDEDVWLEQGLYDEPTK
jgi:hypothetical protein